jgi:hypothetical protein
MLGTLHQLGVLDFVVTVVKKMVLSSLVKALDIPVTPDPTHII